MMREYVDFHFVADHHLQIHDRLINWARYVEVRSPHWQHPMWRQSKSNSRQWHQPEPRAEVDRLDGAAMEKAVRLLPHKMCEAIRWAYVHRTSPIKARRILSVSNEGLMHLITAGRTMLMNRCPVHR